MFWFSFWSKSYQIYLGLNVFPKKEKRYHTGQNGITVPFFLLYKLVEQGSQFSLHCFYCVTVLTKSFDGEEAKKSLNSGNINASVLCAPGLI